MENLMEKYFLDYAPCTHKHTLRSHDDENIVGLCVFLLLYAGSK